MPDFTNINNFLTQNVNQFVEPIYNWVFRHNPYFTLVPRAEFSPRDGLVPKVVTTTSELPSAYPNWGGLDISDGTGSSCDVTPTEILDGTIERDYELEVANFNSRVLCLTDLQFDWQAEQEIANLQQNLKQYVTVTWSDWYRIKNICMSYNKVSTTGVSSLTIDQNADCDFSGVAVPTQQLAWEHLDYIYDLVSQATGDINAVGYSEGQPLYALCCGPGYKRKLWQTTTRIRDTVNWADPFQNFTARGINTSINGYIPNLDLYPIRYAADGTTKIYPTLNTNATKGRKNIPNPAYLTTTNDGDAVYEVFYVLPKNVWEARVRPVGPTSFGMAAFDPINYVGDMKWINNPDNDKNPYGTKGYFNMQIQAAPKPVFPEIGYCGITLALD